nr:hypothetical protein [uncultured Bacteroides sp.]
MKKMKFVALALTLLMGISFTSCLNSDGGNASYSGFVTVSQGYLSDNIVLLTDDGLTLTPTNPSMLLVDKKYPERVLLNYELVAGEELVSGKTKYNVTILGGFVIPVKTFNQRPDTLKNDYKISQLTAAWYANRYVTFNIGFTHSNSIVDFDIYQQKIGHDTLYVKLNYSKGGGDAAYGDGNTFYSFRIPSSVYGQIEPKNDSIWVKILAKGTYETLQKSVRVKYGY